MQWSNSGYAVADLNGYADLVAFARHWPTHPDLHVRIEKNAELNEPKPALMYTQARKGIPIILHERIKFVVQKSVDWLKAKSHF